MPDVWKPSTWMKNARPEEREIEQNRKLTDIGNAARTAQEDAETAHSEAIKTTTDNRRTAEEEAEAAHTAAVCRTDYPAQIG